MANPYYGLELAWLESELEKWMAAHSALAAGKSYSVSAGGYSKQLTQQDLPQVRETMQLLTREIARQQNPGSRPTCSYADFSHDSTR